MDQERMLKLLKLIFLLSGNRRYSINEIKKHLEVSERTAYRYLETLEKVNLIVNKTNGMYLLEKNNESETIQKLIHFTDEEASLIHQIIDSITNISQLKETLFEKLNILYNFKFLQKIKENQNYTKIQKIEEAIKNRQTVIFGQYRSSNSNKVKNRIVEAFQLSSDYNDIWAFDIESNMVKQFKISRIHKVELLEEKWVYKQLHKKPERDVFRMSGEKIIANAKGVMTLRAYNLLIEEFSQAKPYVNKCKSQEENYNFNIPITQYEGIGRFILGLPGEIILKSPRELKDYIEGKKK